ncbi:hypothetical protein [Bifidobacterium simiarum]|uniref:hypothetical protein n=1 Tax=Bifidobacterium simiarum TaxID=2045441 RepID=UPI001BDC60DA|nr:hypothetical protein [Bifidobacterium simiarum]MBT1167257.1 hypothetical protein [Bifidobacterium simiarum]
MSISIRLELHGTKAVSNNGWWFETVPYSYMYPTDRDEYCAEFRRIIEESEKYEGHNEGDDQDDYYYGGDLADLAHDLNGTEYEGYAPKAPEGYENAALEISILY